MPKKNSGKSTSTPSTPSTKTSNTEVSPTLPVTSVQQKPDTTTGTKVLVKGRKGGAKSTATANKNKSDETATVTTATVTTTNETRKRGIPRELEHELKFKTALSELRSELGAQTKVLKDLKSGIRKF